MKQTFLFFWMGLILLLCSVSLNAQTWILFNNDPYNAGGNTSPVSDFATANPSVTEPVWSYYGFNSSTKAYSIMPNYYTDGRAGAEGAWAWNKTEYYYISSKGRVHMKSVDERPAIRFTAPFTGYYKADVTVRRESFTWGTGKAQVWAYFNHIAAGTTTPASMGFDLKVSTDDMAHATATDPFFTAKSQTMYINLMAGDVITFDIGSTSGTGNGGTVWDKLQVSTTTEAIAKTTGNLFFDPYSYATAADIAAYQAAYDVAIAVKTDMLAINSNLELLKASGTTDYGKFEAAKITFLQALGTTGYTRTQFTTTSDRLLVLAAIVELQSVTGLIHQYYVANDVAVPAGWYRIKITGSGKYLTYDGAMKFATENGGGTQIWYLNKTLNNNQSRFACYLYDELKVNSKVPRFVEGSAANPKFLGLSESGTVDGKTAYTVRTGGTGNPTISAINETSGAISYGAYDTYRNLQYRIVLEPVTDLFVPETTFTNGDYNLAFNGASGGTVTVTGNQVVISGTSYPIIRYGSTTPYTYAIGQNNATGYLISEALTAEASNGYIDAMPRPGFTFSTGSDPDPDPDPNPANSGFIHPGLLHTQADFDRIIAKVNANAQPWLDGWNALLADNHSSNSTTGSYWPAEATVSRQSTRATNAAASAYQLALRWKISGDIPSATKAIKILNEWATNCTGRSGSDQPLAAIQGIAFANAAEIMRDYSGWAQSDFNKFKQWMVDIFYSHASDFLSRRNETCDGHYWANWGLANVSCVIAIGILCDDVAMYNEGVWYLKYSKEDGRAFSEDIENLVWKLHTPTMGQWQESNRDQAHSIMGVGLASEIAQTLWNQGDDVYAFKNNRLLAGFEYVASYNLGNTVPNSPFINCDNNQAAIADGSRGQVRPVWEMSYNHYTKRKGIPVPYSKQFADQQRPEAGPGSGASGTTPFDALGFGTLLYTLDNEYNSVCPETALSPSIYVNGGAAVNRSIVSVQPGSTVRLVPVLSSGSGGSYLWSNGLTANEITLDNITESDLYRVTYTNACGTKSVQSFSVLVQGDCLPTKIQAAVQISGTWTGETTNTVNAGTVINMGCQPTKGGTMEYLRSGSVISGANITISGNTVITARYTSACGAVSTQDFQFFVDVNLAALQTAYNNAKAYYDAINPDDVAGVAEGDKLGKYSYTAYTALNAALTAAKAILDAGGTGYSSTQISDAAGALSSAQAVCIINLEKNTLPVGDYFIKKSGTDLYWTNMKAVTNEEKPVFNAEYDTNWAEQLWTVTLDGGRYKIENVSPTTYGNKTTYIRFITEKGTFPQLSPNNATGGQKDYSQAWNTFDIFYNGTDYAVQRTGSASHEFWRLDENNFVVWSSINLNTATDFILEFVPVKDYLQAAVTVGQASLNLARVGHTDGTYSQAAVEAFTAALATANSILTGTVTAQDYITFKTAQAAFIPASVWKTDATDHDWTKAVNWEEERQPVETSVVIIPKSENYPELEVKTTISEIFFKAGAELGRQDLLTYEKAFVQYDFSADDSHNRWNMLSMPLQEAYGGDFSFGGYPRSYIYKFTTTGGVADWALISSSAHKYQAGDGFLLWLDKNNSIYAEHRGLGLAGGIIELPFFDNTSVPADVHHTHDYTAGAGADGKVVGTSRFYNFKSSGGEFVRSTTYVDADRTTAAYKLASSPVNKNLTFASDESSAFAFVGNPFMTTIDFDALYDNNNNNLTIKPNYQTMSSGSSGGYVGYTKDGQYGVITPGLDKYIAPMQAFLVEKDNSESGAPLVFDLSTVAASATGKGTLRSAAGIGDKLEIIARNEIASVCTFIANRENGQDMLGVMDARKLFTGADEIPDIYTLKESGNGSVAVGANIINNDDLLVPVGLFSAYSGKISLTFKGMDSYNASITFMDAQENKEIKLTGLNSYEYSFDYAPTLNGNNEVLPMDDRFFIRLTPVATTPTGLNTAAGKAMVYGKDHTIYAVSAPSDLIRKIWVYNIQGFLVYANEEVNASSHAITRLANSPEIYVVKVLTNQEVKNVKIRIK